MKRKRDIMNLDHIVLKIEPKPDTALGWLTKGMEVVAAATANESTFFSSIAQLIAQLSADVSTLGKAQAAAGNKGKLEIKQRNAALRDAKKSLRAFTRGVQGLCDAATDLEHAKAIAAAASLEPKAVPVPQRPDFYGKALGAGATHLYARLPVKKARGVYWEWAMSTDGGKTWLSLPGTNTANTRVLGLTPLTIVQFRHRTTYKNVVSDWSQVIAVTVH
jgi:hypothetical protein